MGPCKALESVACDHVTTTQIIFKEYYGMSYRDPMKVRAWLREGNKREEGEEPTLYVRANS